MKKHLLDVHCTSRKSIDNIAKALGFSAIGSRSEVLARIKTSSYSEIKKALNK